MPSDATLTTLNAMLTPAIVFDANRTFITDAQCVLFTARRGGRTLRCYVTRGALAACFGLRMVGGGATADDTLRCYDSNVERIHDTARRLIEREGAPGGALVLDLAGALVAAAHD